MTDAAVREFPVKRLKYVVDPARPITYGIVQCGPDYPDGVPYIRPVDMTEEGGVEVLSLLRTAPEIAASYARATVIPGDLVISIGPSFGKVMNVPADLAGANLTQGTARIAVAPPADPRFVFWALRSANTFQQWESSVGGATFRALNLGPLSETWIPMPDPQRQRAIADYLERETARQDALVAAKERVLGLLAENRLALVTRAVTRGLDPRAPLRDSGIPWLGEIPAHWGTRKLRYACEAIQTGGTPSPEFVDDPTEGAVNWFTPGDFVGTLELKRSARKVAQAGIDAGEAQLFPAGAVFVVGIGATLGKTGFIVEPASANQQINVLIPQRQTDSRFLAYLLARLGDVMNISANSATLPILNQQRMGEIAVTLPPLEEQRAIVRWIEEKIARINNVRRATESTIRLLKERRAALIAAAVTGRLEIA
jgi:type I restriction enzyme, S subunit